MEEITKWAMGELSSILNFPPDENLARFIVNIESPRDLEDHLNTLLDFTKPQHQKFFRDVLSKKQGLMQGYKKTELDSYIQTQNKPAQDKKDKKKGGKQKQDPKFVNEPPEPQNKGMAKKKSKFVNLYAENSLNILLKGRHPCECQATKHALVNNCLKCGRIVCRQEGPGPCLFCSNHVPERPGSIHDDPPQISDSALNSALELKTRLLDYDKSNERTKVIDDESDYFSTNSVWLSKEQKEELKKKEEEFQALKHSRARSVILDLTGRRIVDDEFMKLNHENKILEEVTRLTEQKIISQSINDNLDPRCDMLIEPKYETTESSDFMSGATWHNFIGRVQDKQVLEMSDIGVCLSMHQPWATLLVTGIKKHEGRSWYSSHRGRLWIAAAAKPPTNEEIEEVKTQYRLIRGDDTKFPSKYPVGCLLGYVNMVDCLAQEQYQELYPEGESDSPFVFICEDSVTSPVLFPIKGKHKLYKLDPKIHQAAVKCVQKLSMK